jgi:hypothetical protein
MIGTRQIIITDISPRRTRKLAELTIRINKFLRSSSQVEIDNSLCSLDTEQCTEIAEIELLNSCRNKTDQSQSQSGVAKNTRKCTEVASIVHLSQSCESTSLNENHKITQNGSEPTTSDFKKQKTARVSETRLLNTSDISKLRTLFDCALKELEQNMENSRNLNQ